MFLAFTGQTLEIFWLYLSLPHPFFKMKEDGAFSLHRVSGNITKAWEESINNYLVKSRLHCTRVHLYH